ncbi:hypothetical protein EDD86DRAFT_275326 [Gorgonomyces haynaldii]|nr:hypothetical protein EDD86DRAFT_275326 [Gorgonomyces haynaldii]
MQRFQLKRMFSKTSLLRADTITGLYLQELKQYKPAKSAEPSGLPETFALPKPPAKPEVDGQDVVFKAEEQLEEAAWPKLVDPIDDPANYNDVWDFRTDKDSGSLFPGPLKPVHYDDH